MHGLPRSSNARLETMLHIRQDTDVIHCNTFHIVYVIDYVYSRDDSMEQMHWNGQISLEFIALSMKHGDPWCTPPVPINATTYIRKPIDMLIGKALGQRFFNQHPKECSSPVLPLYIQMIFTLLQ